MLMADCNNCGRRTGFKRALGFGTLFMVVITFGVWLLVIPFYPARCVICGTTRGEAYAYSFGQRLGALSDREKILLTVAAVVLVVLVVVSMDSIHLHPPASLPKSIPPESVAQEKSWLDKPANNWNEPGSSIPRTERSFLDPECQTELRGPTTETEKEVVQAGWLLSKDMQQPLAHSSTTVIVAYGETEGMCRPGMVQAFVFLNGLFVGTVSPQPAAARATGNLEGVRISSPTRIEADFSYYNGTEPMCCPSRLRSVYYEIREVGHDSVLAPIGQREGRNPSALEGDAHDARDQVIASSSIPGFTRYTNGRFGFSIDYPQTFVAQEPPQNGDGIKLTSPDGEAVLIVAGGNNSGFTLREYYDMSLRDIHGELGYQRIGGNWFVITWKAGDQKLGYLKMFVGSGSQNSFTFTFPETQKPEYEEVVTRMEKSFRPGKIDQAW